jgi:hypothetical protein
MLKRIFGLCLVSIFLVSASAQAQVYYISGTVQNLRPVVFGKQSAVLLSLQGRSEIFVVRTLDAPKFGLLKPETAAAPDQAKMAQELATAKGWRVKLAVEPKKGAEGKEFTVKTLERLPEK